MRTVVPVVLVAAVAYGLVCAYVYATQRSQMYFPTPATDVAGAEVLRLASHGATLKIWVVPRPGPKSLIYFGGNAEEVSGNLDGLSAALPEHTLYLVNYRGYGGSTGGPSEAGFFADALAIHDYVRARQPQVSVMGRSLGSGVAVYLASQRPVDRLVLATPFDSLANVARAHFRFLPVGLLMRDQYDSAGRVRAVTAPTLIVIAGDDEIIPRARSDALVAAFGAGQARVEVIPRAAHNTLDLSPDYMAVVKGFLAGPGT